MPRPNYRLVKIHRSYTVDEAARRLEVHRQTIREWIKRGLQTCNDRRPTLILGRHLVPFLKTTRQRARRPCAAGELYCVRCRVPRRPRGDAAQLEIRTRSLATLVGTCPQCSAVMYRTLNLAKLNEVRGTVTVAAPSAIKT